MDWTSKVQSTADKPWEIHGGWLYSKYREILVQHELDMGTKIVLVLSRLQSTQFLSLFSLKLPCFSQRISDLTNLKHSPGPKLEKTKV